MAKTTPEADSILKEMPLDMLGAFSSVKQNEKLFEQFQKFFNSFIVLEKDKIVGLASDTYGVDDAIKKTSKQNFHRGRTSAAYLLHVLFVKAQSEIERRESRSK